MPIIDGNTPAWHAGQARSLITEIGKIAAPGNKGITDECAATVALTHAVLAVEARLHLMSETQQ